eukprot:7391456-Prymnesium_polylepis.3
MAARKGIGVVLHPRFLNNSKLDGHNTNENSSIAPQERSTIQAPLVQRGIPHLQQESLLRVHGARLRR